MIAIENVRLFQELQARQTATSPRHSSNKPLQARSFRVIASSPTDLQPVFDAIVGSATRVYEATFAALHRFDGQVLTFDAHHGMTEPEIQESRRRGPLPPGRGIAVGRAILDRRIGHIHDIRRDPDYRSTEGQMSFRTILAVPLLREGKAVGALGLWRREVQPFSDKQIALVETFADQAVIAIENVRLFEEFKESNVRSPLLWSSRRQRAKCCASSPARRQICRPFWMPSPKVLRRVCNAEDAGAIRAR